MLASRSLIWSFMRRPTNGFKILKACVLQQELMNNVNPFRKQGMILACRPFSLSSRVCRRKAEDVKGFQESRTKYATDHLMYAKKLLRNDGPKNKKKMDELRKGLDGHLQGDKLEGEIKETVEMVRQRLKLSESSITSLNFNIDYLISIGIPFEVVSRIATRAPKVLKTNLKTLKTRIKVLKINSIYEDSMVKIFKKNPSILLVNLEDTLSQKVCDSIIIN